MKGLQLTLSVLVALSVSAAAHASLSTREFVKRFSRAIYLINKPHDRWPWDHEDDIGQLLLPLATASDQTMTQALAILDKKGNPKRTAVGDLLLVIAYDAEIPMVFAFKDHGIDYMTMGPTDEIRDVLLDPLGGVNLNSEWPWRKDEDGTWILRYFSYDKYPTATLSQRLALFQSKFKRRKFDKEPVYWR